MDIQCNLPPQRCPYCDGEVVDGVCQGQGCQLNAAHSSSGYLIPTQEEEFPIVEV